LERIVESGTRTKGEFQLTDALNLMMKEGTVLKAFDIEGWYDCGKPETLLETNRALLERAAPNVVIPGSIVLPPVHMGKGARIEASIVGPYVSVAENSQVKRSIVRNSIVGENALVEDALLDASLVGDNAVVRGKCKKLNVGDSSEIDFT
jgi:glucose-1-phosphate thymidylyltransferase